MILILFYMEDLKRFLIGSIEATAILLKGRNPLEDEKTSPLQIKLEPARRLLIEHGLLTEAESNHFILQEMKYGKKLNLARKLLVDEGILTEAESLELRKLIDYRDTIGHQIHNLTAAVGPWSHLMLDKKSFSPVDPYDDQAVIRATALRKKIHAGFGKKFIVRGSFDGLKFEAAETVYLREIKRLKTKVNKGILQLNNTLNEANKSIKAIPDSVLKSAQPGHPHHQKANGNLTDEGKDCICQLYQANVTPLAVAHMMRISLRTANFWYKKWLASKQT